MIWKCAEQQFTEMADPTEHGWIKVDDSFLEPTWTKEDILPEELLNLYDSQPEEEEEEDEVPEDDCFDDLSDNEDCN